MVWIAVNNAACRIAGDIHLLRDELHNNICCFLLQRSLYDRRFRDTHECRLKRFVRFFTCVNRIREVLVDVLG